MRITGHLSATVAVMVFPVEVRVMETCRPQLGPFPTLLAYISVAIATMKEESSLTSPHCQTEGTESAAVTMIGEFRK